MSIKRFNLFRSIFDFFQSISNQIRIRINQICHDDADSDNEFGSKMLIKS